MKQYVIDEIRLEDYSRIRDYLKDNYKCSSIDNLYWIQLQYDILSGIQKQHEDCSPFHFSISLKENSLSCELLIRSTNRLNCPCITYANTKQINWIIKLVDSIFKQLDIIT